jgi:hypothetical protein
MLQIVCARRSAIPFCTQFIEGSFRVIRRVLLLLLLSAAAFASAHAGAVRCGKLIDAHVHLTGNASEHGYKAQGVSTPRQATIGVKNARLTLTAGFTSVRNVGADGYTDVAFVMKGGEAVKEN